MKTEITLLSFVWLITWIIWPTWLVHVYWVILSIKLIFFFCLNGYPLVRNHGPVSSVDIATDHELDGLGSNSGGDEISRPSRPALGPNLPPVQWVPGSFPGVKCSRGVLLTTHPLLVPRSWKSRAIPLPTLWATPACNGISLPLLVRNQVNRSVSQQSVIQAASQPVSRCKILWDPDSIPV